MEAQGDPLGYPFQTLRARYLAENRNTKLLEHLRMCIVYGGATNAFSRSLRSFRIFYAEHPYGKSLILLSLALLLSAALFVLGRDHVPALARAAPTAVLSTATGVSRRVNAWLRPPLPTAGSLQAPMAAAPATPMYYDIRYPNQSYRIAAYCWAAFWIILAGPLVLALVLPAWMLLLDFSAAGFKAAYNSAAGILLSVFAWGRLWFALLLLSLMGFAGFKLYGRFSLPKRMPPRIRLVYGTLRFAIFGAVLASVGTFLSYFSGVAAGLYNNPLVRMLIDLLRQMFGL